MSFSGNVKEELSHQIAQARHCQIAELAALISMCGAVVITPGEKYRIKIHTEKIAVARKCFTLVTKTFNIRTDISVRRNLEKGSETYMLVIREHEDALRILQATKLIGEREDAYSALHIVDPILVQQPCCKRAFLRGAFLAAGSMSDPNKAYHFEIVCTTVNMAEQLRRMMCSFSMDAKIVARKKMYVVYLKEGAQLVDMLNIMEAHVSLMELENVRILKEMRNAVNRKVNCETANINKTVSAAVKQVEDIRYIQQTIGLDKLSDGLKEMAILRLEHPDATLKELGEISDPPVGKSGVNHRLRKIGEIAEDVRQNKED
ncbi:putative sporulation transcription regulator WhiA [Mediterraneibacter butyricigenes]|uniref:Probable cell division protein WhiA n=1 Tax=Mediterraneibacter butyricigenes TaxID=2316025 RepID=A0A391P5C1_9FIRM|nr:DNA-binding protein WhiA [Mediterraneibacter butyricigenes]GCA67416.1 putative sporulation transcription regulator WhiA [Mediterraneibacter butyricigenes]